MGKAELILFAANRHNGDCSESRKKSDGTLYGQDFASGSSSSLDFAVRVDFREGSKGYELVEYDDVGDVQNYSYSA